MKILSRNELERVLSIPKILDAIEQGFIAYSCGETTAVEAAERRK